MTNGKLRDIKRKLESITKSHSKVEELCDDELLEYVINNIGISNTNNIYVYMGTYQQNDNITEENPCDFIVSYDDSNADYRLYIDIESPDDKRKIICILQTDFEKQNIDISNIKSLISYNLVNWQIIPFFIFDDEGGIKKLLDNGKIIEFDNNHYDIPNEWKYVWGLSNNDSPLKGKDFELANFTDLEIKNALNEILKDQLEHENNYEITIKDINEIRRNSQGINQVCNSLFKDIIKYRKTKIVKLLFYNLFKEYEYTNNEQLLNRPIFELIKKINDIRINYPKVYDEQSKNYFLSFITSILNEQQEDLEWL